MTRLDRQQWLVSDPGSVDLQVVAKPGAGRRRILRRDARGLLIELNSHPSKGSANEELTVFLAELLGTPRSSVTIIRGHTARVKTVRVLNPDPTQIARLLQAYS
jgi:uncharacterized protein YggU (UPF0235/DUF167 family)